MPVKSLALISIFLASTLAWVSAAQAFFFFGGGGGTPAWRVQSETPLFDPAAGVQLPGTETRMAIISTAPRSGAIVYLRPRAPAFRRENSYPKARAYYWWYRAGQYTQSTFRLGHLDEIADGMFQIHARAPFKGREFSLHPTSEEGVYIAQYREPSGKGYLYGYLRLYEGRLFFQAQVAKVEPGQLSELQRYGRVDETERAVFVADQGRLQRILGHFDAMADASVFTTPPSTRDLSADYSVFGDAGQAKRQVFSELCLYFAQSEFAMGERKDYAFRGVAYTLIEPEKAQGVCDIALETGATETPVRYAAARAFIAQGLALKDKEMFDRGYALIAELAQQGLEVAQASMASRDFGDPWREAKLRAVKAMLKVSAMDGNKVSNFLLGQYLRTGALRSHDDLEAEIYLRRARIAGVLPAWGELAALLLARNTPEARTEAIELLERAARAGDAFSQQQLGELLFNDKHYTLAFENFRKAADQGNARALHFRGYMYMTARGTENSDSKAYSDLQNAVRLGADSAKVELGGLLCAGCAGRTDGADRERGKEMLETALKSGAPNAQYYLDRCTE